jgi:Arc/MetJ-type ribon-helix-helix transcriptional regulator
MLCDNMGSVIIPPWHQSVIDEAIKRGYFTNRTAAILYGISLINREKELVPENGNSFAPRRAAIPASQED